MPSIFKTLFMASAASAATHVVSVSNTEGQLVFEPQNVTAAVGDMVEYHFWPMNHSVVAGNPTSPCTPLSSDGSSGFYSGFMPTASGMNSMVFQLNITNTDAWAFYCSQGKHCQNGMWGMINGNDTFFSTYKAGLSSAEENVSPSVATAFGGDVVESDMASSNGTTGSDDESAAGSVAGSLFAATFAAAAAALALV